MTLAEHVERYVTFRRALGHTYVQQARCLQDYAAYAEARGESFVRTSTVLDWASTTPSPRQAQVIAQAVRGKLGDGEEAVARVKKRGTARRRRSRE